MKYYYDRIDTQIAEQKATEKANYTTLLSQMNQYPDANIQLTDTLEQANAKITANSAIYRQQTRLADGTTPTSDDDKVVTALRKAIVGFDKQIRSDVDFTREDIRDQLETLYPDFDPIDIEMLVYQQYPDEYVNRFN